MRLFSWLPLFFLLQYSLCGQQDPMGWEAASLSVIAEDAAGAPIPGVAISVDGVVQAGSAPATLRLEPGIAVSVSVSREEYVFAPAQQSVLLPPGASDTLVFTGSANPARLTVLAETEAGAAIAEVGISVDGVVQGTPAPLTLDLVPGRSYLFSAAHAEYSFAPADTALSLEAGAVDTLRFIGSQLLARVVLVEDFSNTGCVPCPEADAAMWAAVAAAGGPALPLAWHPNFPAPQDPFFLYNPVLGHYGNTGSRNSFYGISQLPHIRVDGAAVSTPSSQTEIAALIAEKLALPPALELAVTRSENAGVVTVSASGRVLQAPAGGSWRLYLVLMETLVEFDAPNGQTEFRHTVRHVNGEEAGFGHPLGEPIALSQGATIAAQASFSPNFAVVTAANLRAVAFVQDSESKLILEAALESPGGP